MIWQQISNASPLNRCGSDPWLGSHQTLGIWLEDVFQSWPCEASNRSDIFNYVKVMKVDEHKHLGVVDWRFLVIFYLLSIKWYVGVVCFGFYLTTCQDKLWTNFTNSMFVHISTMTSFIISRRKGVTSAMKSPYIARWNNLNPSSILLA